MRIEFINTVTGKTGAKELPPKLNPVWVGHNAKNHLVLDDPHVGPEALAIDNDVAGGGGWRVWNRNGRPLLVGGVRLGERNQCVRLAGPRVVVDCWPFVLTLCLAPGEWDDGGDPGGLDRSCAELVRDVHQKLVDLHSHDPAERAEWLRDEYVHRLEEEVAELAAARDDFPADNLGTSELATHMAGVAVRSAVVHRLAGAAPDREPDWARFRLAVPELEAELARLVAAVAAELELDPLPGLTEQVAAVDAGFWPFWDRLTAGGRVAPRVRRYLALRRLTEEAKDVWYGLGPLEDLLDDPTVSDVMVVGADEIFVEKNGRIESSGRRFVTDPMTTVQRLMGMVGRPITVAHPIADARMPDGSRVNAIIPPLALRGPYLTIRRFPNRPLTTEELVRRGSLTPAARDFLRAAVVGRRNIIVSGGTGTGKTTLLNCLSAFIPHRERIITIEDTAELRLQKEHVAPIQTRPKNSEDAGEVTIRDLVRNALRMRPDRIVVGECRGGEALDMLQAMNTGHDGSMTTLHANDPRAAVDRLVVLVQQAAGSQLPVAAVRQQIVSAIDLIVQLSEVSQDGGRRRVVSEITEVAGYDHEDDAVRLVPLFRTDPGGSLAPTGHLPSFLPDLIARNLVPDPVAFVRGEAYPV